MSQMLKKEKDHKEKDHKEKDHNFLWQIFVSLFIALIAGAAQPWWWDKFFGNSSQTSEPKGNNLTSTPSNPQPIPTEPPRASTPVPQPPILIEPDPVQPTPAPIQRPSPARFVSEHYTLLNQNKYDTTWQHLSINFQVESGGYNQYVNWWNKVARVDIGTTNTVQADAYRAVVDAHLVYVMKRGDSSPDNKPRIFLIWSEAKQSWLIDNKTAEPKGNHNSTPSNPQPVPTEPPRASTPVSPPPTPSVDRPPVSVAVEKYYDAINKRNYQEGWMTLSTTMRNDRHSHPNGFASFTEWWTQVEKVNVLNTKIINQDQDSATTQARLKYQMKSGEEINQTLQYQFVWDLKSKRWLMTKVDRL